jgi:hypothetical protein
MLQQAQLHEDVSGSGGIALRILNLGFSWMLMVIFTPEPLYPRCKFDRRLGGPQSRSGRCGEEKESLPLPVYEQLVYHLGSRTTLLNPAG